MCVKQLGDCYLVTLSPGQISWAERSAARDEAALPDVPNYTGFEHPDRYPLGRLGEAAFMVWARWARIHYEYMHQRGRVDEYDFRVGRYKIDVKNSEGWYGTTHHLAVSPATFKRHTQATHYFGAAMVNEAEVILFGYCTRAVVGDRETQILRAGYPPCYAVPRDELTPVGNMIRVPA